jgi:hypothetical protein
MTSGMPATAPTEHARSRPAGTRPMRAGGGANLSSVSEHVPRGFGRVTCSTRRSPRATEKCRHVSPRGREVAGIDEAAPEVHDRANVDVEVPGGLLDRRGRVVLDPVEEEHVGVGEHHGVLCPIRDPVVTLRPLKTPAR